MNNKPIDQWTNTSVNKYIGEKGKQIYDAPDVPKIFEGSSDRPNHANELGLDIVSPIARDTTLGLSARTLPPPFARPGCCVWFVRPVGFVWSIVRFPFVMLSGFLSYLSGPLGPS